MPPDGNDWGNPDLSHTVTFEPNSATATLDIAVRDSGTNHIGIASTASVPGTLTARIEPVAGYRTTATAAVEVLFFEAPYWEFAIDTTATSLMIPEGSEVFPTLLYAPCTAVCPLPLGSEFRGDLIVRFRTFSLSVPNAAVTGSPSDFIGFNRIVSFYSFADANRIFERENGFWTARQRFDGSNNATIPVVIHDDEEAEGDENIPASFR